MKEDKPKAASRLLTLPEAMQMLGIKLTTLNQLCRQGRLEKVHIGKRALITVESIQRFIASLKT